MKNNVDIWVAWVNAAEPYSDQLIAMLSAEEKARASRMVSAERGRQLLLTQGIVRHVLSRYLKQPPSTIVFQKGAHGKPYVEQVDWRFNITHSGECVLVAVTTELEVGVDLECLQKTHRFDELVERFFSPQERDEYRLYTSDVERRLAFYRGWTRKEAYLKAIGLGLSYPLDKFTVALAAAEKKALLSVDGDVSVQPKWTLFSFEVGNNYLASLAVEAPDVTTKVHNWSFDCSY